MEKIGKKLKDYREKVFPNKGLRKVADIIKIHFVYLNRIENNLLMPSDDMISNLSKAYGLTEEQEFKLFQLAKKAHLHPKIQEFFDDSKKAEDFFRKIKK
jgi:transcriptional regulator with XRE-family HTH domain